jgi:Sec7-like guanine-nucleotide exchange factor
MFERLKAYKIKHGDLLVHTNRTKVNHNLGGWVHLQRIMHKTKYISPERKEKLDSIGFPWATRDLRIEKQWMTMYEKLLEFEQEYNHCMVNPKYNEKLARWVSKQRKEFKEEIMSNERRELLEEVGFTWKIGTGKRDRDTYMWK